MLFIGNGKRMISDMKSQLAVQYEMKDLGAARYIIGIEIIRHRASRMLWMSQRKYVNSVLEKFSMTTCKQLVVPMLHGTKLSKKDCPKSRKQMEDMSQVLYVSVVGSLMYVMVCTRLDITQAVGVL